MRSEALWRGLVALLLGLMLVLTLQRNEVWREDKSLWLDALEKAPGSARPHLNLAVSLLRDGDEAGAEYELREALRIRPYHPHALAELGTLHVKRGETDEAIALYRRGLSRYPEVDGLWLGLGIAEEGAGRADEAEGDYRRALELNPQNLTAILRLGHLLRKEGRMGEMFALMRWAVGRTPEILDVQPYLGEVLRMERAFQRPEETSVKNPTEGR